MDILTSPKTTTPSQLPLTKNPLRLNRPEMLVDYGSDSGDDAGQAPPSAPLPSITRPVVAAPNVLVEVLIVLLFHPHHLHLIFIARWLIRYHQDYF